MEHEHGNGSGNSNRRKSRRRGRGARNQDVSNSPLHSPISSQISFTPYTSCTKQYQYYVDEEGYYHEVSNPESAESEQSGDDANKKPATTVNPDGNRSFPIITLPRYQRDPVERELLIAKIYAHINSFPRYDTNGVFAITFDGYYRKKTGIGGYGAMLWRGGEEDAGPLYAVSGGSRLSVSAFYHALEGLLHGLDLVPAYNLDVQSVFLVCNSERMCETLRECFINLANGTCGYHPQDEEDTFILCTPCLKDKLKMLERTAPVVDIMRRILEKGRRYNRPTPWIASYRKHWNEPADYLAKYRLIPGTKRVFEPKSFPDKLKALVSRFGGRTPFLIR